MTKERMTAPDDVLEWYVHFFARFSNLLYDHKDEEDQRETVCQAEMLCDEWEEKACSLSPILQAVTSLNMFDECISMSDGSEEDIDGYGPLAERCARYFIENVRRLNDEDKEHLAFRIAHMFDGHFGSTILERILTELVGPTYVGDVLDIIRFDLYRSYRDFDDQIIDLMDVRYREFAKRLIESTGKSVRGDIKNKLTIKVH